MTFQKGQSGNPAGRPRGSRNKACIQMERKLERKAGKLLNKAVEVALTGNVAALRLCLERLLPQRTSEPLLCEAMPLAKAADAVTATAELASAAVAGDITADQAAKLAKVISVYVNALEAHDFEEQLAALERTDVEQGRRKPPMNDNAGH